jgi:hypothetical protein
MGSLICIDTTTGYAVVGSTATTLIPLGVYQGAAVTNSGSSGAKNVTVYPGVFRFANSAAADAIAVTEIGQKCYIVDDNTVAKTDGTGTRSQAGTVVNVDAAGVWVCVGPYPIPDATYVTLTGTQTLTNKTLTAPTITAPTITGFKAASLGNASFVANDCALAVTGANSGGFYSINTTAGASTVSLSAGAGLAAGHYFYFVADGTKNGHTVTYRDGSTAISSAKTASKRHCVKVIYDGTAFYVVGEISP